MESSLLRSPLSADRVAALKRWTAQLRGESPPLPVTRHFVNSDYTVHQRPRFTMDLRMYSRRTFNSECDNYENQRGWHLAEGASYTYRDGHEYWNGTGTGIFPAWDWERVPGTLARHGAGLRPCQFEHRGPTSFVGAVVPADAASGQRSTAMSALALQASSGGCGSGHPGCVGNTSALCHATSSAQYGNTSAHNCAGSYNVSFAGNTSGELHARRAFIWLEEGVLALSSEIRVALSGGTVGTTLDQCLFRGSWSTGLLRKPSAGASWVEVPGSERSLEFPSRHSWSSSGTAAHQTARWVRHHGVYYVWVSSSSASHPIQLVAEAGVRVGSWAEVSPVASPNTSISKDVLTVFLDHGRAPITEAQDAAHLVLPGLDASRGAAAVAQVLDTTTVIQNDREVQAVLTSAENAVTLRAVFWPGARRTLNISRPSMITGVACSQPAIVSITVVGETRLFVSASSPTQTSGDIVITIEGAAAFGVGRGCDAGHGAETRVTLRLDEGAQLGLATVSANCTRSKASLRGIRFI